MAGAGAVLGALGRGLGSYGLRNLLGSAYAASGLYRNLRGGGGGRSYSRRARGRRPFSMMRRGVQLRNAGFKSRVPAMLTSSREEVKTVDYTLNPGFLTTGIFLYVNQVQEGSGFWQRIGRKISIVSIQMKGCIKPSNLNAAAIPSQTLRYMLIYDRAPTGALPTLADVLQDTSAAGANSTATESGINMDNKFRFAVLRDRIHIAPALGANGGTPAAVQGLQVDSTSDTKYSFNCSEFIRMGGAVTQYNGSVGDVTQCKTGAVYIMVVSSTDANANPAWGLYARLRIRYVD